MDIFGSLGSNSLDLCIAIGNTGCGKSTMLTSLMFGTDMLNVVPIQQQIKVKKGKSVIIYTPGGGGFK